MTQSCDSITQDSGLSKGYLNQLVEESKCFRRVILMFSKHELKISVQVNHEQNRNLYRTAAVIRPFGLRIRVRTCQGYEIVQSFKNYTNTNESFFVKFAIYR